MAWFLLSLAGLLEMGWAVGLKYTDVHAPDPNRAHSDQHDRQFGTAGPVPEEPSVGNRLRDLDRCRNARHGCLWDRSVRRGGDGGTPRLHRANLGRHRRPQTHIARVRHRNFKLRDYLAHSGMWSERLSDRDHDRCRIAGGEKVSSRLDPAGGPARTSNLNLRWKRWKIWTSRYFHELPLFANVGIANSLIVSSSSLTLSQQLDQPVRIVKFSKSKPAETMRPRQRFERCARHYACVSESGAAVWREAVRATCQRAGDPREAVSVGPSCS
jgi:hypothetical protein